MPQLQLPIFPEGTTQINNNLAFSCEQGRVYYFNGHLPVFSHDQEDLPTFRLFTTQLIINGAVKQGDIVSAFGVPLVTVKRYVKCYREHGPKGFYTVQKKRSATKLTPAVLKDVQERIFTGQDIPEIGRELGLLPNTIHKAISSGRLQSGVKKNFTKSDSPRQERTKRD